MDPIRILLLHMPCPSTLSPLFAYSGALLYQNCFILTAGHAYDLKDVDANKHITNLSINKVRRYRKMP